MTGIEGDFFHPILFQRFPQLRDRVPWMPLGSFPTPIQPLEKLGIENLWIKRDDLSSPLYGGNKVRKLEFALADAKSRNRRGIVTMGGLGTHHGLATAIFAQKVGLSCTLLLFHQPVTFPVKQNLLLLRKHNARILYKGPRWRAVLSYMITHRFREPASYYLFAGGSNVAGTIGFVNAALELRWQIDQGLCPEPSRIFCAVGSNGTMAGLALGAALAGLRAEVVGVRVSESHLGPFQACTPGTVGRLMKRTLEYLRRRCPEIPKVRIPTPIMEEAYFGGGYAQPTPEGREALQLTQTREGITLDLTYTAKTFSAVLDHCKRMAGRAEPTLYWHTYNSADLSALAAS
jgi:1-aminocyclopropane-1-carboxylate deaminase/D-cysteine desulfhydrase-like pyridoxal-dependent ACC family enzyme